MSDAPERYPPLSDYGVIANGLTSALISRSGSVDWCCLPRLDSASAFGRLLDWDRGGFCQIRPVEPATSRRRYVEDSLVLATTFSCSTGEVVIYDLLPFDEDEEPGLLRIAEGAAGTVELEVHVEPRFDFGQVRPWLRRDGPGAFTAIGGDDALVISGELGLEPCGEHALGATVEVSAGQRVRLALDFARPETIDPDAGERPAPSQLDRRLDRTIGRWREWATTRSLSGPLDADVLRSAVLLRGLTHPRTGAMAAAATTSLPEAVGAQRNWDYRFSWIRDSSFAVRALAEVGFVAEADAFRRFVARSSAGHGEELQIAYGLGGERRLGEQELGQLEGYRGSRPVRSGNAAVRQLQLDTIGEVVNLTWRWHRRGHDPDEDHWRFLVSLIDVAAAKWRQPDSGMWEWRAEPLHFVHSKALCWSALERGIRLAEECRLPAPLPRWARARDSVRAAIEREGYDAERNTFVQAFGRRELDAGLLLLPLAGFVGWDDERMVGTVDAVRAQLDAGGGLLFRYPRGDGLGGREGAFLACTFWLAECLARQGRLIEAREAFEAGCATANDLGIFSEEYDPARGEMLGNLPQALTHLSHISAAVALSSAG